MRQILTITFCFLTLFVYSQDTTQYIKVHFLYGSKPLKKYKHTEQKWFGGVFGGHVGIEIDSNKIFNFHHIGKLHLFPQTKNKHSSYAVIGCNEFYATLGSNPDSVKKAIVIIPVTESQIEKLDSISNVYLKKTPYDYALFGMRCSAAAYEILGQLNILPHYSHRKTYLKIFYPKKLRKRLFRKAKDHGWTILKEDGSVKRKWEKD